MIEVNSGTLNPSRNEKIDEIVVVSSEMKDLIDDLLSRFGYKYHLNDFRSNAIETKFKNRSGHTYKCIVMEDDIHDIYAVCPYYILSYLYTLVYRLPEGEDVHEFIINYIKRNVLWLTFGGYSGIGRKVNMALLDLGIYYSFEDKEKETVRFTFFEGDGSDDIITEIGALTNLMTPTGLTLLQTMGEMNIYDSSSKPKLNDLDSMQILEAVINFVNKLS